MLAGKILLGGRLRTLSFVDSATVINSATITIPASAQAGDIAVLVDWAINASAPSPSSVVPTGWTSIVETNGSFPRIISSAKVLASGEPGSAVTGMNGSLGEAKTMLVFRGNRAIVAFTAYSTAGEITAGDPAAQVVTSSGGPTPVLVIGSGTSTNPMTSQVSFSPSADGIVDNSSGGSRYQSTGYKIYTASPADVTVDMADYGSINGLQSFYLSVR